MKLLNSLADLQDAYDLFVFSIYGVLHDGIRVHEGVYESLEALYARRKSVAILSNVPRLREPMLQELASMGIAQPLFQYLQTAGQDAWDELQAGHHYPHHPALGDACYLIGHRDDFEFIEELPFYRQSNIEQSNFILVLGTDEWHQRVQDYTDVLDAGLELGLPLICANPDIAVCYGDGVLLRGGALAQYYAEKGGTVLYHGKPYPNFYKSLFDFFTISDPSRVLFVGDSLQVDVQGATQVGFHSLLLLNPTTLHELGFSCQSMATPQKIFGKIQQMGYSPTYMSFTSDLKW